MSKKKTRQQNVIIYARALGVAGKHAGSKPVSRLTTGIRSVIERHKAMQRLWELRNKNRPVAPATLTKDHQIEEAQAEVVQTPVEEVVETTENNVVEIAESAENSDK